MPVRQASVAAPRESAVAKVAPVAPLARVASAPTLKYNDLMSAVMAADPAAVQELLAMGKWPDKPNSYGVTPLMVAAQRGDQASAKLLLRAGADPYRALGLARERRDEAMTSLLENYRK